MVQVPEWMVRIAIAIAIAIAALLMEPGIQAPPLMEEL